jgi:hypothetical protein
MYLSLILRKNIQDNQSKFVDSEEYADLCTLLEDYLVEICSNVISIGFNYLNNSKSQENEAKDFAAKNILLNAKSVVKAIIKGSHWSEPCARGELDRVTEVQSH